MPVPARQRELVVRPEQAHPLLGLHHRADVVVDHARALVAALPAGQIAAAQLVIPVQQRRGQCKKQGGSDGIACVGIQPLDINERHLPGQDAQQHNDKGGHHGHASESDEQAIQMTDELTHGGLQAYAVRE